MLNHGAEIARYAGAMYGIVHDDVTVLSVKDDIRGAFRLTTSLARRATSSIASVFLRSAEFARIRLSNFSRGCLVECGQTI